MFALADAYLFRPLPYTNPEELVLIRVSDRGLSPGALVPRLDDWRSRRELFQRVAAYSLPNTLGAVINDRPLIVRVGQVTNDFLEVLGIPAPSLPRSDEALLILTRQGERLGVSLNGIVVTTTQAGSPGPVFRVVKVLPDDFVLPSNEYAAADGFSLFSVGPVANVPSPEQVTIRRGESIGPAIIARVQPGVTPTIIQQALSTPWSTGPPLDVRVQWLAEHMTRDKRPVAWGALAAGLLVLIICAGNAGNLFVVRGLARGREFATRTALGATRGDLTRLLAVEVLVVALSAVGLGVALAAVILRWVPSAIPVQYTILGTPHLTPRLVGAAVTFGIMVTAIGLLPGLLAVLRKPTSLGGERIAGSRSFTALRFVFMSIQVGLAMVLTVGAGMLVQSYWNLIRQDSGYRDDSIIVQAAYPFGLSEDALERTILSTVQAIRALPEVKSAGATVGNIAASGYSKRVVAVKGEEVFVSALGVTQGFFDAAGLLILAGRPLNERDEGGRTVVINEAFARQYLPEGAPLQNTVTLGNRPAAVVGLVKDTLADGLALPAQPTIYYLDVRGRTVRYVVRVDGQGIAPGDQIQRLIAKLDARAFIGPAESIGQRLAGKIRERTFAVTILALFCMASISVTVCGLVGMVVFLTQRRTREIAIRVALGAGRAHVLGLVSKQALAAAMFGGGIGLFVGRALSASLEAFVFRLQAGNWPTTLVAAIIAALVMIVAALVPALRALRLQPTDALRID